MGFFGIAYPEAYGGLDLDLFYTVIFLEELQKINSGGFAAAMWAHAYLAMTHVNAIETAISLMLAMPARILKFQSSVSHKLLRLYNRTGSIF